MRRRAYEIPADRLKLFPGPEIARFLLPQSLSSGRSGGNRVDELYRKFDQKVANWLAGQLRNAGQVGVYAYEDGAEASFRIARSRGVPTVYELPIGYWRRARKILEPELERWPQWRSTLINFEEPEWKLERKDRELSWADRIVVASRFTRDSLADCPAALGPVEVIPYGAPASLGMEELPEKRLPGPLRALFVGSLGLRKGVPYLFEAANALGAQVEWTIIGRPVSDCPALMMELKKHRWIPSCSNQSIIEEMRRHDVLVLPSLFEGFGLVLIEALASGIPVVATPHTAAPDLIDGSGAGRIIPVCDSDAIARALDEFATDADQLAYAKQQARETVKRWTWQRYAALMEAYLGNYG